MKKIHWVLLVVAIVALAGAGYVVSQADSSETPGQLEVAEAFYDFGTVGLANVSHAYTIKNTGSGPLRIRKISTSCGCTTAMLKMSDGQTETFSMDHGGTVPAINIALAPGEEAQVVATYNPLAHGQARAAGTFNRSIYVLTDNPRKEYELTFRVQVYPDGADTEPPRALKSSK